MVELIVFIRIVLTKQTQKFMIKQRLLRLHSLWTRENSEFVWAANLMRYKKLSKAIYLHIRVGSLPTKPKFFFLNSLSSNLSICTISHCTKLFSGPAVIFLDSPTVLDLAITFVNLKGLCTALDTERYFSLFTYTLFSICRWFGNILSSVSLGLFKRSLGTAGNALARVQRVHKPADLWDITFCTRWFWGF